MEPVIDVCFEQSDNDSHAFYAIEANLNATFFLNGDRTFLRLSLSAVRELHRQLDALLDDDIKSLRDSQVC